MMGNVGPVMQSGVALMRTTLLVDSAFVEQLKLPTTIVSAPPMEVFCVIDTSRATRSATLMTSPGFTPR